MSRNTLTPADWLLTESLRRFEEREGRVTEDQAANQLAQRHGASIAQRLAQRARALPLTQGLDRDLARLATLRRRLCGLMILLAALLGFLAARAGLANRELDILLTSLALLALPMMALLIWIGLLAWSYRRPQGSGQSGRWFLAALIRGGRLLDSPLGRDLMSAQLALFAGGYGRWYASSLSHAFWLVYSLSALGTLIVFFSVAQYQLVWGTTLLTEREIAALIQALAAAPAALGLVNAPSADWIAAGRLGLADGLDRAEWARLMLGLVAFYGALPRAALLGLSLLLLQRSRKNLSLNLNHPGYQRLLPLLQPPPPPGQALGSAPAATAKRPLRQARHSQGPLLLVTLDIETDRRPDPGRWRDMDVLDLGTADRREQRQQLSQALKALPAPPPALLIVCSLLRTPDSGTAEQINQLADAAGSRLLLLLVDSERLNQRSDQPQARIDDWHRTAQRCGGLAMVLDPADGQAIQARLKDWPT